MNTNKIAYSILISGLIISIGIIFTRDTKTVNGIKTKTVSGSNIEVKDGIQYITINTRGGYFPRTSIAKSGIPTRLVMKTQGTYDCSAALIINSLGYQNMLPPTGETIIDAGTPTPGKSIRGMCGMGMYNFSVEFN